MKEQEAGEALKRAQASESNVGKKQGEWKPDPSDTQRNLAVQFIDHTVKDFQKISLKQITNPVKIGEGAAAVVYKA